MTTTTQKPLTFDECIKLLDSGGHSFDAKLMLNGCFSRKTIYFEANNKIEVFNYIDESTEIMGRRNFKKWFGDSLYFDGFN